MKSNIQIETSWKQPLKHLFESETFTKLADRVRGLYQTESVFPESKNIFRAFDLCPFDKTSVVILGQDPYHGASQADGLCFSVPKGTRLPPSLLNIFKEMSDDLGIDIPKDGDLSRLSEQGVLLLNSVLTVKAHTAASHQNLGWEEFTNGVIQALSDKRENIVFILWGAYAQAKTDLIDKSKHMVLCAPHPSPLSAHRGFLGCKHFSKTNEYLTSKGKIPIEW